MATVFLSIRPARKSAVETVFAVCESIHVVEHKSDQRKDLILRALRMKDNGNLVGALRTGSFRLVINLSFKH